jgi:hypothetical protein
MTSSDAKIAKIQTSFQALSEIAPALNTASDELTKTVSYLDEALKKLNVGLAAWVTFNTRGCEEEPQAFDEDQIGYSKVNGVWGIALRRMWGDPARDEYGHEGPWLFNDASREMRLLSIDKIPEVIEKLAKDALNTKKKVEEKTKEVRALADAIGPIANTAKGKAFLETGKPITGFKEVHARMVEGSK